MSDNAQSANEKIDPTAGRRPWIRVDEIQLEEATEPPGTYRVRIRGHNLHMAISPPAITLGGVPLEQLRFEPDGKAISGTLQRKPAGGNVVVDYGFAKAEGLVEMEGEEEGENKNKSPD